MGIFDGLFGSYSKRELAKIEPIKNKVLGLEDEYAAMSEETLKSQTNILKERLAKGETLEDILPEALATVREAAWRVLGKKPFPVQIIGAIVLNQGRIAEMKTGEGKTLVACCASYLCALEGKGVHVVTVNDYLAKFQSEEMGKVYRYLGLTIGCILHDMDNEERREAYKCDITYATNNELGFDYLRDNMVIYMKDKVQREHHFAIVDEVDSILIDEARTPLIISGRGDKSTELYTQADKFARTLTPYVVVEMDNKVDQEEATENCDYIIDEKAKTATITRRGVKKAEKYFNVGNLYDADNSTLLHHVNQALKAHGIMKVDTDYIVKDGEVFKAIVDRDNMQTKVYTQTFSRHKAMGKAIVMNTQPSALYSAGLPGSLVNGVLNEDADAATGEWMAWQGEPVEVVIDMAGESYEKVSVRTFVSKWEDMYAPLGMSAYVSEDNVNFVLMSSEEYPIEEERVPDGVKLYDLEFPATSARYLKVIVNTVPALPAWSERPGRPAYLFVDEIKVE